MCPCCGLPRIKKIDSNDLYNKYSCWNKDCECRDVPFAVLNLKLADEDYLDLVCEQCEELYEREFYLDDNGGPMLAFKCQDKLCRFSMEPHVYDLKAGTWHGEGPRLIVYEDQAFPSEVERECLKDNPENPESEGFSQGITNLKGQAKTTTIQPSIEKTKYGATKIDLPCEMGEIPLLSMNAKRHEQFLNYHEGKVIVFVDVPNFIRTLRDYFPREFEQVLQKAHELLYQFVDSSFNADDAFIVRYYTKPDEDLAESNLMLMEYCRERPEQEFFHSLRINKQGHLSDIDNYLIANAVEVLEACDLRGFVIVSSDKDYLPVMKIAGFKGVRSFIFGVNAPGIYDDYGVENIKVLGLMNFFA